MLAFSDPGTETPVLATAGGGSGWSSQAIEEGGGGFGISLAVTGDGEADVTYYTLSGEVRHATVGADGAGASEVIASFEPDEATFDGWNSSIAAAEDGALYATWYDGEDDLVLLASNEGGEWKEISTEGSTQAGRTPVLAANEAGQVFMAWYDSENEDLNLGQYPSKLGLLAVPSPHEAPAGDGDGNGDALECPKETTVEIAASPGAAGAGFDESELEVAADEPTTMCFLNEDEGQFHNVAVYSEEPEAGAAPDLFDPGGTIEAPDVAVYEIEPLPKGEYFYNCTVHPTTMIGTLTAA